MKTKMLLLLIAVFLIISCDKEENKNYIEPINNITACGYDDPLNQLTWLNKILINGKDVSKTSFVENVWIKEYKDKDVVVIDFGLTSSMFSSFDCLGNSITIENQYYFDSLSDEDLIYKFQ